MNLKTFCLFFFLISFLAFSPEVMAEEGTSSDEALSPSTIFDPSPESVLKPRNNIGKTLQNNGFKLQSVKEEKDGFTYYLTADNYKFPSYVKIFTKDGYTVRYRYAIHDDWGIKDQVSFDALEIKFPSKSAMDKFMDSLKASLKRKGYNIFSYPNYPNVYWIGPDDSYLKKGNELINYQRIIIKGNNVVFYESDYARFDNSIIDDYPWVAAQPQETISFYDFFNYSTEYRHYVLTQTRDLISLLKSKGFELTSSSKVEGYIFDYNDDFVKTLLPSNTFSKNGINITFINNVFSKIEFANKSELNNFMLEMKANGWKRWEDVEGEGELYDWSNFTQPIMAIVDGLEIFFDYGE